LKAAYIDLLREKNLYLTRNHSKIKDLEYFEARNVVSPPIRKKVRLNPIDIMNGINEDSNLGQIEFENPENNRDIIPDTMIEDQ
jgi:hypothetical protein